MSLVPSWIADPFVVPSKDAETFDKEDDDDSINQAQPPTTRGELWGYYLYYNGDNGFTTFAYMPTIFQYLAYSAGHDPSDSTGNTPCNYTDLTSPCNVYFGGSIPLNSMLLYIQAISFAAQFVIFTTFGGLADYGKWNKWILFFFTCVAIACQIIPAAFFYPSDWKAMAAVVTISNIAYGATLVFYSAAFPVLADNLPIVRAARRDPTMPEEERQAVSERWRNHVSTISTTWSNVGFLIITAVMTGVSYAKGVDQGDITVQNPGNFNQIGTSFSGAFWALNAIFYFLWIPKGRQGPPVPQGTNILTIGWTSIFQALKEIRRLKQAFMYIIAYFLFSDANNTINSMIGIIQNDITSFSGKEITILNFVSAITSIIGCISILAIQKRFGFRTKTMLLIILVATALIPIWGCFGIRFDNFGIRTHAELWVFYIWSGIAIAPVYAYQQTMLAELIPRGKEGLFFGLFGIVNKASSWIGPVVIAAVTSATDGNLWNGWPFIVALFAIPIIIICFIDEDKARADIVEYDRVEAARENATIPRMSSIEKK